LNLRRRLRDQKGIAGGKKRKKVQKISGDFSGKEKRGEKKGEYYTCQGGEGGGGEGKESFHKKKEKKQTILMG